ncbi:MAG: PEP/pyruvate-binding domain-containing protein [Patescibacteria group bacterium]
MPDLLSYQKAGELKKGFDLIGGKAHALIELVRAGFAVPGGFIVTTDLFDYYLSSKKTHIEQENEANSIKSIEFSVQTKSKIDNYLNEFIDADNYAVRSSASVEDALEQSFAGQFESYLNVSQSKVSESIKGCWASLYSVRVNEYMKNMGVGVVDRKMGVLVQRMLNPTISGIAFSAHPVTKNKSVVVIEAIPGSNDALVQGTVNPCRYIIDKKLNILEKKFETQHGNNIFNDDQIIHLTKKTIEAERIFGYPVDIEWSVENGSLYFLQCRPITTMM